VLSFTTVGLTVDIPLPSKFSVGDPLPLNPDPLIVIVPLVPITRGEGETEEMAKTVPGAEPPGSPVGQLGGGSPHTPPDT